MPSAKAGKSSVEVVADVAQFGDQLERDLNAAIAGVDVDARPLATQISDTLDDAADKARESFEDMGESAREEIDGVADEAAQLAAELETVDKQIAEVEKSIKSLAREFARTGDQDVFKKLRADRLTLSNLRQVRDIVDEVGDEARESARELDEMGDEAAQASRRGRQGFSDMLGVVFALGASFGSLAASLPSPQGIIVFTVAVLGIAAAIPVVLALGAALADLLALLPALPAAGAVAAAVMGTLKVALHGVADAFAAVIEGDPDKLKEALKELSPAARSVVREFRALLPTLKATRGFIQEQFFQPLRGSLTELGTLLLPTLRVGMGEVAGAVGRLGAKFVDLLQQSGAIDVIGRVFDTTVRIIDRAGGSMGGFLDSILRLVDAGLPILEELVELALDGADSFFKWFRSFAEAGGLEKFVQDAFDTLSQLWDLAKAAFNLIGALFSRGDDAGRSFIGTMSDALNAMAEFLRSAEGQEFLQNLIDLMPLATQALENFVMVFVGLGMVINGAVDAYNAVLDFFQALPGWVESAASAVGDWFVNAWNTAYEAVAGFFIGVGQWFADLPGMIWGWMKAAAAAFVGSIAFMFEMGLRSIGIGIGVVLFTFLQLPGLIWRALNKLPGLIGSIWSSVFNTSRRLLAAGFNAVVSFFTNLPRRAYNALRRIITLVRSVFSSMVSSSRSAVVSGFNSIVAFINSVPRRLSALRGRFLSAGRGIIQGFLSGLRAVGGFAGNVGGAIVGIVRSGLNRVIGSINSGIASIDRVLPGSLPRIPYLARGGMTSFPTLAALSEFGQREVVVPVDDPRTIAVLREALGLGAGAGGIVLGPGAVVVNIDGPVTEERARAAGVAAGQGFLDTIDRRAGRMAVRTL